MTVNEKRVSTSKNWNFLGRVAGIDSKNIERCFSCGICVGAWFIKEFHPATSAVF
ncbi:MAG: hypothetical protein ACTSUQ_05570 [Candidatus Freyarchaeota archaeon]